MQEWKKLEIKESITHNNLFILKINKSTRSLKQKQNAITDEYSGNKIAHLKFKMQQK